MPGPTIQWKTVDTEVLLSEIREPGRYRLASPAAVTGAPSLAMQAAGQNCTVRTYIGGVYRSDSLLTVPSTTPVAIRNAVGQPLTGQEMFDMVIEVGNLGFGSVLLTTDEPNGSPSSPFTSTWSAVDRAALAAVSPPRTIVYAENPCTPEGVSKLVRNAAGTDFIPAIGECIVDLVGLPLSQVTPGVLTLAEIYGANVGSSPIVPDFMTPIGGIIELSIKAFVRNSVAPTAGSIVMGCFSGSLPDKTGVHEYPQAATALPDAAGYGIGESPTILQRASIKFTHGSQGGRSLQTWEHPAVSGANRVWVMAKPSDINDVIAVQRIHACYTGGAA